jgi:hypothetical protein
MRTVRDEMAMSGRLHLAAGGQMELAAHTQSTGLDNLSILALTRTSAHRQIRSPSSRRQAAKRRASAPTPHPIPWGRDTLRRAACAACSAVVDFVAFAADRTVVDVIRDDLVDALLRLGVPAGILVNFPILPRDARGLLVYGSQARGDAVATSDLDLLALVDTPRPSTYTGDVNVSYYTGEQLTTGIGTLFGAHLKRDSKIVWDPDGMLATAVDALGDVDTDRLLRRAWQMSQLFTTPEQDLPKYLPGLL